MEETLKQTLKNTKSASGLSDVSHSRTDYIKLDADGKYTLETLDGHSQDKKIDLGDSFDGIIIYQRQNLTEFPEYIPGAGPSKPILSTTSVTKKTDFATCKMSGIVDVFAEFRKNNQNAKLQTVLGILLLHDECPLSFAELTLKVGAVSFKNPNNIANYITKCNTDHEHVSLCVTNFGCSFNEYNGNQYTQNTFSFSAVVDKDEVKKKIKEVVENDVKMYVANQASLKEEYESMVTRSAQETKKEEQVEINADEIPF